MSSIPEFLSDKPEPHVKQRLYNGRKLMVWEGKVATASIQGWVDNPRIDLVKRQYKAKVGERELTQAEVFNLMKTDPEVRLNELRDDIIRNGLREPLTLSFSGKLLDGNRRFFALKHALETLPEGDPNRQDLECVPAFVLTEDASDADEDAVLVEENFSHSLKIEWPDYVKAQRVIALDADGLNIDQIRQRVPWAKTKIRETLRIHELISDFMQFAIAAPDPEDESGGGLGMTEEEAEIVAAKNYQYFNEAQKSFFEPLKTDIDFKLLFFRWLKDGKFSSFPEVRIAYKAWKDDEARPVLMGGEPTAAKAAKAIIDYNSRVVKDTNEAVGRIDSFEKFLRTLTVDQLRLLPAEARERLQQSLETVIKMNIAATEANAAS